MTDQQNTFPEIGWFKERFQVLEISRDRFVIECLMSGKNVVPPHLHKDCDEEFSMLEGTLTVKNGKEIHELHPGNKIVVPKGVVHSLKNRSKEKIRFRVSMTPDRGVSTLFEIMLFLKQNYPEKKYSVVTAMYILNKLRLKEFSTPVGYNYYFETTALKITQLLAPMFGWPKLARAFSSFAT